MAAEAGRAPLAGRGERHGLLARPARRGRKGLPDGGQRRVAVLLTGERPERRPAVERDEVLERDAGEQDSPWGTMPTSAATGSRDAAWAVSCACI